MALFKTYVQDWNQPIKNFKITGFREKFVPNDGIDQPYWKAQETNKINRKHIYQQLQHWWRPQQG